MRVQRTQSKMCVGVGVEGGGVYSINCKKSLGYWIV